MAVNFPGPITPRQGFGQAVGGGTSDRWGIARIKTSATPYTPLEWGNRGPTFAEVTLFVSFLIRSGRPRGSRKEA
jgi:hypothetical protein